jgi:hypothetical protein
MLLYLSLTLINRTPGTKTPASLFPLFNEFVKPETGVEHKYKRAQFGGARGLRIAGGCRREWRLHSTATYYSRGMPAP